jgi:class 3 adenylate cyclase
VQAGPLAGHQFEVVSELILGRSNADITIDDAEVSRRHAVIRSLEGTLEIEDLGSLNGTLVNGERITAPRLLREGDLVTIGGTTLEVGHDLGRDQPNPPLVGDREPSAAARYSSTDTMPAADAPAAAAPAEPPRHQPPTAAEGDELRPVTALFADIVGSTGLGERLSPDEVKLVVGECVTRMCRAVEQFGGKVQAYMGDGIAVFFGAPTAHEDDPERAARAALRILDVVAEYAREVETAWGIRDFSARVGLNTGATAVGLVGASDPRSVSLGDTTNVAARLQSIAQPGTIVVGEATAKSILPRFVLEALGEVSVKGRVQPVPAWRLVGIQAATESYRPGPLVGRAQEMERLYAIVEEVTAGRGQLVLIVGDAGLGKTRLLAEVRALAAGRVMWLEGQCLSYGTELLYGPFIEMLRKWIGAEAGQAELVVRTKLRATLALLPASETEAVLPYLARLLGVTVEAGEDERLRRLLPEELASEIRKAYRIWLTALASRGPLVVAIEDLHWADVATRELAEDVLELADSLPILFIGTLRVDPESEGWNLRVRVLSGFAHRAVELSLNPLPDDAARELLALRPQSRSLGQVEMEQIVRGAEGNPLYLEELLSAFSEGRGPRPGLTSATMNSRVLTPTLESLLVARIDRLSPQARRLAQVAAVVGRSFPVRVLQHLAETGSLEADLAVLLRADIIRELRLYPEREYVFRHGLLRTASLSTLPPTRRRQLYASVGTAFESLFSDSIEDNLEVLAHYFARSDDLAKALAYLERAGERAASLDATDRAVELWQQASQIAEDLGDTTAQQRITARLSATGARAD